MKRGMGVLLHVTSLPTHYGIGTLGKDAYDFVDFLHKSGQSYWQMLPLSPLSYGDSPYQSVSAFAGNPYLIDLNLLIVDGLLSEKECGDPLLGNRHVDYERLFHARTALLLAAFDRFDRTQTAYQNFLATGQWQGYGLFMALKAAHGYRPWNEWDAPYKNRDSAALRAFTEKNKDAIEFWQFTQYLFFTQFAALKRYANAKNVQLIGDAPIYVAYDSEDVWANRSLFKLKKDGTPSVVAGVPPDGFSATGQLWGNPIYRWNRMKKDGYAWYVRRIRALLELVDIARIDHFRGFDRYYEIKAGSIDATRGRWRKGPGMKIVQAFHDAFGQESLIAEDLGLLDESARKMFAAAQYPGMKILQFAFDGSADNEHLPKMYTENCLVYTGTHDNETLMQTLEAKSESECALFFARVNAAAQESGVASRATDTHTCADTLVELAVASRAVVAMLPIQDLLREGKACRMNLPGTVSTDNWSYRVTENAFSDQLCARLKDLAVRYDRLPR